MILSTCDPGIVGDLMVIPDADKGFGGTGKLQIRIGMVLLITTAVVVQRDGLCQWVRHPPFIIFIGVFVGAVFIDVVAEVQHHIRFALCQFAVYVEHTRWIIGAGTGCDSGLTDLTDRQGFSHAFGRNHTFTPGKPGELIVVSGVRRQASDIHFDRIVPGFAGVFCSRGNHLSQVRVCRHHPAHSHIGNWLFIRGHPGPDDHPVRQRIARRNSMAKNKHRLALTTAFLSTLFIVLFSASCGAETT